jgi:3-isopropylmalate dehydrogenase
MKKVKVAVVFGDGSGPEMVAEALRCMSLALLVYNPEFKLDYVFTPMGWNAYEEHKDTTPESSIAKAKEIGLVFFGGVGDPKYDKTWGKENPQMMPEARALLRLRKEMGLLLNFRPMDLRKELAHLSPLRPELIPDEGVKMVFVRFLLEDSYFGNQDTVGVLKIFNNLPELLKFQLSALYCQLVSMGGVRMKQEVTGEEDFVTDLAYYRRTTMEKYFRAVFEYARQVKLPVLSIDKANVMARYVFWRKIAESIAVEYRDVTFKGHQYVDSANALLFNPKMLHGVIPCGNEHGDILSDGAAAAVGGLGLMHSSAVNPENGAAMFESGAGTAPTLAGQDKANPIGRILTGAMLLRHIGATTAADKLEEAVWQTLGEGHRTADIAEPGSTMITGCVHMGDLIREHLFRK